MTSLFLPIVTAKTIRDAVRATILTWADTYTAELGRQLGASLPPIKRFGSGMAIGDPEEEFPACIITAPGLMGDPERRGDGSYVAPWAVGVGIVVKQQTITAATELASSYIAVLRALIVQQGKLGGLAIETIWTDEEISPLQYERDAAVVAGTDMFRVLVPNVVNRFGGPSTPPVDPAVPENFGEVTETSIDIHYST